MVDALADALLCSMAPCGRPGNGAGVRDGGRGALGGKLHWLAPAIAVETAWWPAPRRLSLGEWSRRERQGAARNGGLSIRGIPSLGVDDCPLMSAAGATGGAGRVEPGAKRNADRHRRQGQPECSGVAHCGGGARGCGRATAPDAAAGQRGGRHRLRRPAAAAVWVEASRGFLMPSDWDPAPLMKAAPLGLRSGMRQKQRDRVAAGGAIPQSDYSIAEGVGAVDIGRLAVRMGEGGFGPRRSPSPDESADIELLAMVFVTTQRGRDGRPQGRGQGNGEAGNGIASNGEGGDDTVARAVIAEVASIWQKLSPPLPAQLRALSVGLLEACSSPLSQEQQQVQQQMQQQMQ